MAIQALPSLPTHWVDPVLDRAQAERLLGQSGHVLLQAAGGGHLLGLAVGGMKADILTLVVPEALRRQGRAEALLQAFLRHAKAQGATGFSLEVRADNAAAIALYAKLGLTVQHRRVGYYGEVDALVLGVVF